MKMRMTYNKGGILITKFDLYTCKKHPNLKISISKKRQDEVHKCLCGELLERVESPIYHALFFSKAKDEVSDKPQG